MFTTSCDRLSASDTSPMAKQVNTCSMPVMIIHGHLTHFTTIARFVKQKGHFLNRKYFFVLFLFCLKTEFQINSILVSTHQSEYI